jgi:hypothetical protein
MGAPEFLRSVTDRFAASDEWVPHWQVYPDVPAEIDDLMPECDRMSERFARFATAEGAACQVVRIEPDRTDPAVVDEFLPDHWVTVVTVGGEQWAVDWTARQHWNVRTLEVDPDDIPCPAVWVWSLPVRYPVPGVPYDGPVEFVTF